MVNSFARSTPLLLLWLFLSLPALAAAAGYAERIEAKEVMLRYLDAMQQGDTFTMRSMMAGNYLERNTPLLRNPAWPGYLAETFGTAAFSIGSVRSAGPDEVIIEVYTHYGPRDTIASAYVLRRAVAMESPHPAFRIHDEFEPEADTFDDSSETPDGTSFSRSGTGVSPVPRVD